MPDLAKPKKLGKGCLIVFGVFFVVVVLGNLERKDKPRLSTQNAQPLTHVALTLPPSVSPTPSIVPNQSTASAVPNNIVTPAPQMTPTAAKLDRDGIPEDVEYNIINVDCLRDLKCSFDVGLNKMVSEKTLEAIAHKIRADEGETYERVFICYTLPRMKVGSGAWATTHFDPDLKVNIIGLTEEQAVQLRNSEIKGDGIEVIGAWIDEGIGGHKVTLYKEQGSIFMQTLYAGAPGHPNESAPHKEMVIAPHAGKESYEEKSGNRFGEYYSIDESGKLLLFDKDGLFRTLRKAGDVL